MRRRKRKRYRAEARLPLVLPVRANQVWTMDFTHDQLVSGRKFRTLNLMDGFTREALAVEVDHSLPGVRVVRVLEQLRQQGRKPEWIVCDNGPEFAGRALEQWAGDLTGLERELLSELDTLPDDSARRFYRDRPKRSRRPITVSQPK